MALLRSLALAALLMATPVFALTPDQTLSVVIRQENIGSVPRGAERVPLLSLDISASCDAAQTLRGIVVTHRGRGDARDIERLYMMQNGQRISRAAAFDAQGKATIRFRTLSVKACQEVQLQVWGDFSTQATAGGEHQLTIAAKNDVDSSAQNIFLSPQGAGGSALVKPVDQGMVTVEYLSVLGTQSYGAGRDVARIRLKGDARKNQIVHAITFTNDGSARDADLQNLSLVSSRGEQLSAVLPQMDGAAARIDFPKPLLLERNNTIVLTLKADIRASRRRTIRFLIDEPSDIQAETCAGTEACLEAH